jgi:hypothetical protein
MDSSEHLRLDDLSASSHFQCLKDRAFLVRLVTQVLLLVVMAMTPMVSTAQMDPVADLQQQNADLGVGCNEIALAQPLSPPLVPDQQWQEVHTACIGTEIAANVLCSGEVADSVQTEACLFRFSAMPNKFTLDCSAFVLLTKSQRYVGPEPELTKQWAALLKSELERQNLPTTGAPTSCTVPTSLGDESAILVVFRSERTDMPYGLWVTIAMNQTLGFIVDVSREGN